MSIKEQAARLGKEASYRDKAWHDFFVSVKVLDVRAAYGRIDYQVTPISGHGTIWVSSDKLTFKGA